MFKTYDIKPVFYGLIFAASVSVGMAQAWAQEDDNRSDVSTTPLTVENYYHLKFPAIDPLTLGTDRPRLQDSQSGDVVDYYGPCDHDPLSKDEVESQEHDKLVRGLRNFGEMGE